MGSTMITTEQFRDWLASARRGDELEFHRGYLARDRASGWRNPLNGKERKELGTLADLVWDAAMARLVHPYQRRHGDMDYTYIARRAQRS